MEQINLTVVSNKAAAKRLYATVEWDGENQIIDANKGDKAIRLQIGWKGAWIGQTQTDLE
ncbi:MULTISPECIES: stalk domain-containing protein [unclassified Paenibacillus]|uniref:stalk domain-containing protein n=1 Tax=unclassified Paenibacillus TaxID=185978 RepID=UPI001AE9E45D|nr:MULTISPECIES: stalk domain-containing protein [unclassified Paenibacillus]MBP1157630.1 hypothetical protein [Paenibacillus sp. PvP091]MBP1171633.1 hypothetical protein [Paenibacillus sp. PvR098]MBP2438014.1 hypothetical protein [Paenibacillus sp. PvP052]